MTFSCVLPLCGILVRGVCLCVWGSSIRVMSIFSVLAAEPVQKAGRDDRTYTGGTYKFKRDPDSVSLSSLVPLLFLQLLLFLKWVQSEKQDSSVTGSKVAPLFLSLFAYFLLAWTSPAGNCGKAMDKRGDWNERGRMPEVTHRYFSDITGTPSL